jgi:hypothetical protein
VYMQQQNKKECAAYAIHGTWVYSLGFWLMKSVELFLTVPEELVYFSSNLGFLTVQASVHRSILSRNFVAWIEMWFQSGEGGSALPNKLRHGGSRIRLVIRLNDRAVNFYIQVYLPETFSLVPVSHAPLELIASAICHCKYLFFLPRSSWLPTPLREQEV